MVILRETLHYAQGGLKTNSEPFLCCSGNNGQKQSLLLPLREKEEEGAGLTGFRPSREGQQSVEKFNAFRHCFIGREGLPFAREQREGDFGMSETKSVISIIVSIVAGFVMLAGLIHTGQSDIRDDISNIRGDIRELRAGQAELRDRVSRIEGLLLNPKVEVAQSSQSSPDQSP